MDNINKEECLAEIKCLDYSRSTCFFSEGSSMKGACLTKADAEKVQKLEEDGKPSGLSKALDKSKTITVIK